MAITIHIPTPLRPFVNNQDVVKLEIDNTDISGVLKKIAENSEGISKHLFNAEGSIRNFVNVYLNEEDIRYLNGDKTLVKNGDEISIVPSIAGGYN